MAEASNGDAKRQRTTTQLEALKAATVVVADTGEIEQIKKYKPQDATTNPSLLLKAASMPEYKSFVDDAIKYGTSEGKDLSEQDKLDLIMVRSPSGQVALPSPTQGLKC